MGKIIAIANFKGGVGKTATAFNLAAALWVCGKTVCIVDCDDQADLTLRMCCDLSNSVEENDKVETLYGWMKNYRNLSDNVSPILTRYPRFDFVPARSSLATIEMTLEKQNQGRPIIDNYYESLRKCLKSKTDKYDYIILDCPPSTGFMSTCVFIAADEVIIPVACSSESLDGVEKLCQRIDDVKASYDKDILIRGCLLTCYKSNLIVSEKFINSILEIQKEGESDPQLKDRMSRYGLSVLQTKIRVDENFKKCAEYFANIFEFKPNSKGVADYMSLARELYNVIPPVGWKKLSFQSWYDNVYMKLLNQHEND